MKQYLQNPAVGMSHEFISNEDGRTATRATYADIFRIFRQLWGSCTPEMVQMMHKQWGDETLDWTQIDDGPILKPELPWEQECIEAAAVCRHNGRLFMFYAGAYNNKPQQIGCAVSDDGVSWQRLSDDPFLPNGAPGTWNARESGHPYVFVDGDGSTHLFFQGNNDNGRSWYLSRVAVTWDGERPRLIE